jgi:hypothetical protein
LELNADKTEILQLGNRTNLVARYNFEYMNTSYALNPVEKYVG